MMEQRRDYFSRVTSSTKERCSGKANRFDFVYMVALSPQVFSN